METPAPAGATEASAPPALGTPVAAATTGTAPPHGPVPQQEESDDLQMLRELVERRGYGLDKAQELMTHQQCEECGDRLGTERKDDCECACHCACCCSGFFRCISGCACECACHYDPNESDATAGGLGDVVAETPTSSNEQAGEDENVDMETVSQAPAGCPDRPVMAGSETDDGKQEASRGNLDDDEDMSEGDEDPRHLAKIGYEQLYTMLKHHHVPSEDATQPSYSAAEVAGQYFAKLYTDLTNTGQKPKANTNLPTTTETESASLNQYFAVLFGKSLNQQRFHGAFKTVVLAILRSSWSFDRVLQDRIATAALPTAAPTNAWGSGTASQVQKASPAADSEVFRFDTEVFSADRIAALRKICQAHQPFAATCRKPTDDEWCIIMGIMSGTILVRAIPQFFKRVCNLAQMNWVHQQMVLQAEGELYCKIPPQAMMYDYNQSSKRIADKLRKDAAYQKWDNPELERLIQATKTLTYNADLKALHFHFFTKKEAIQWEGMEIPFGNKTTKLINPDARYRETKVAADGTMEIVYKAPIDGLEDDRYQGQYRFRVTNITRTMEIDKFALYLQQKTNNGIKLSTPIDSYGPASEWSLLWDFYAHKATCPPELASINRIMWRDHAVLILHKAGSHNAPCHQCARIGHVATACSTPQVDWMNEHTLQVTDEEIRNLKTERSMWRTPDEAKATFSALGTVALRPQSDAAPVNSTPATPSPDPTSPAAPAPSLPAPVPNSSSTTATPTAASADNATTTTNPTTSPPILESKPNNNWLTAVAKHTQRRMKNQKQSQQPTSDTKKPAQPERHHGNRFQSLGDHNDEEEDEAENTDKPTRSAGVTTSTTQRVSRRNRSFPKADDSDSVADAVHRADLERLGLAIKSMARKAGRVIDHAAIQHHLKEALTHATESASKAWILNALTEALLQHGFKTTDSTDLMVELTTLLKYGIFHAKTVDAAQERGQANPAAILDFAEGSKADRTQDELHAAMNTYYTDLATSSSELHHFLPTRLWGGNDTMRMTAKLLQRKIFIVADSTDPTRVTLSTIFPTRLDDITTQTQFRTATIDYPSLKVWFQHIQQELQNGTTPIILHYTGNHFNSVILQQSGAPRTRANSTKATKMTDHWKQQEGTIVRADQLAVPDGPTRVELVSSQSSISTTDVLKALTQPNWDRHEKKMAIDAMIRDPPRLKELLAIHVTHDADGDAAMESSDDEASVQLAQNTDGDTNATAPSGSVFTTSDEPMSGDTTSSAEARDASYVYHLPSPAKAAYNTWSQQEWERVVQEWAEQDGELLPPLTDRAALAKFAAEQPTVMTQLAKWYANPFVLLDHLEDEDIKGWMTVKRMQYCLRHLETIVHTIPESPHRTVLMEWLLAIANVPELKLRINAYRDSTKWAVLREVAQPSVKAVPFLHMNFTKEFALVLVLDDLFPTLARDILINEGKQPKGEVELPFVFCSSPAFQHALKTAMDPPKPQKPSWKPIEDYIHSLRRAPEEPVSRC